MTMDREAVAWRRATRECLLAARALLAPEDCARRGEKALANLQSRFSGDPWRGTVAGYRPMRGEIDPAPFLARLRSQGVQTALPVVCARARPLLFRVWRPGEPLVPGPFGTEHPSGGAPVLPSILLIPVVGFDGENYRMGYGGGYYDRTLAGLRPRPFTIGIGFELGRLPSIRPRPHDIPLDLIVTEV